MVKEKDKEKNDAINVAINNNRDLGIQQQLFVIQQKINAPKTLTNEKGNFQYRNIEVLLQDVIRPLLVETGCSLTLSDRVVNIGGVNYVESTAEIYNIKGESVKTTAYAREHYKEAGRYPAQITGSCSSYARKYAVCGLFAIGSGVKDLDADTAIEVESMQTAQPAAQPATTQAPAAAPTVTINNNNTNTGEDKAVKVAVNPGDAKSVKVTGDVAETPAQAQQQSPRVQVQTKIPMTTAHPAWGKLQVKIAKSNLSPLECAKNVLSYYDIALEDLKLLLKQSGKVLTDEAFNEVINNL